MNILSSLFYLFILLSLAPDLMGSLNAAENAENKEFKILPAYQNHLSENKPSLTQFWQISSTSTALIMYAPPGFDHTEKRIISIHCLVHEGLIPDNLKAFSWESRDDVEGFHFLRSHPEYSYDQYGLSASLFTKPSKNELDEDIQNQKKLFEELMQQPQTPCIIQTDDFVSTLMAHKNIIFILGAGISAEKIWTLPDFHQQLGLKDKEGTHTVTEESFSEFLEEFIPNSEKFYPTMTFFVQSLKRTKEPTQAHLALKEIKDNLEEQGKNFFLYSGNLDELEEKAGLKIEAEDEICPIPSSSKMSNILLIMVGLRGDHAALINQHLWKYKNVNIYSFNKEPVKIFKFDKEMNIEGLAEIKGHVLGDIQQTIPELSRQLKEYLSK